MATTVTRISLLVLALLLVAPVGSSATLQVQSSQRQGLEMSREELQMRILRGFEHRVMRALELNEDEIVRIREVVIENREARGQLMVRRREVSREIEEFARNGGTDAEARTLLTRQRDLRVREVELQQAEEEALLEVLSESELLRYLQMRSDLIDRIRELERRSGGGRDGDGASRS